MEVEVGGKGKEEVESSPGGIAATTMDKVQEREGFTQVNVLLCELVYMQ